MNRIFVYSGLIALVVSAATISIFNHFKSAEEQKIQIEHVSATPSATAVYTLGEDGEVVPLDFTRIAQSVTDAVVHIKATQAPQRSISRAQPFNPNSDRFRGSPFDDFFGPFFFREPNGQGERGPSQARVGTGSGVIINSDGYIVTNNHVIADADDLEVTLHDNRTYKAVTIGTDPTTDLALLQIKEKNLPSLPLVDSDEVKVGEWVMAVGNPFNLTSTVTAGIVSAKGRSINILQEQFAVESFIQTDAAINPGNSGGALVNLAGGLIGINTAIASPTGAYSGYGFAVPANIVRKVVEDLLQYGAVQRGVLGVMIRTVDGNLSKEKNLAVNSGVYVDSLLENSAAAEAGVKIGDVILRVDEAMVASSPQLQEVIARHRPGDEVTLLVNRKGKEKQISVKLHSRVGNTALGKEEGADLLQVLGVELEEVTAEECRTLQIDGGVRFKEVRSGKLSQNTDVRSGFIVTKVDGRKIGNSKDFVAALDGKSGGVMLEGIYPDLPGTHYYAFGM